MAVDAAQRDQRASAGFVGNPPEPALHLGVMRRQRVAERNVGAGAAKQVDHVGRHHRQNICGPGFRVASADDLSMTR